MLETPELISFDRRVSSTSQSEVFDAIVSFRGDDLLKSTFSGKI